MQESWCTEGEFDFNYHCNTFLHCITLVVEINILHSTWCMEGAVIVTQIVCQLPQVEPGILAWAKFKAWLARGSWKKNCLFKSRENLFQFRLSWVHSCLGKEDILPWPSLASYQGSLLLGRELTTSGTVETWKTGSKCWHYWQKKGASLMSSTEFTRSKISIQNVGTTPWIDILYIFCYSTNHQMIYPG